MKRTEPKTNVTPIKPAESRHDKWVRLGNFRAKRVISNIRALGQLGSDGYERLPDEVDRLESAIRREVDDAFVLLRKGTRKSTTVDNLI